MCVHVHAMMEYPSAKIIKEAKTEYNRGVEEGLQGKQGCCSTVYGTVYGNTVRYGKTNFYRIFENWHRIYGKIRYGERYGAKLALPVQKWPQNGLSAPKPPILAPRCAPPMC